MKQKVAYWAVMLMAVFSAVLLSLSCSGAKSSTHGKGVRLTYWPSSNPHEIELARRLVAEWNEAHPDTTVVLQPLPEGRSGEEVLIISAAGGTAPDICSNVSPVITPLLAKAGVLVPLDQFPDGRQVMAERMPEGMIDNFIAPDGKLYQVPWKGNPIMVEYNMGVLKRAGVTELPRTWSEWDAVARKVSRDWDGDGRQDVWMADINIIAEWRQRLFDFYPLYIAATSGSTLLTPDQQIAFNSQATLDVFDFFARGFREGWYARSVYVGDVFLKGYMAAHITGPWNIAHTERFKPEGFEYDFGPIPVPDDYEGPVYTFGDPKSIGIFATSEHPDAAWAFVRFLVSREADLGLLETCTQFPLRKGLLEDSLYADYFEQNPVMVQFAELVPQTRGFDQNPALQEVFDAINAQFDAACIQGARDSKVAVDKAVKRSKNILDARGF